MKRAPILDRRVSNLVTLRVPVDPNVTRLRVSGHKTLNGAAASGVNMFEAPQGEHFRSPEVARKGLDRLGSPSTLRHATVLSFDPDEYQPLSANLPFDKDVLHLVVEGFSPALGSWLSPSPVLIIPPAEFFGLAQHSIPVSGQAPGITAVAGAIPPANALKFALPKASSHAEVVPLTSGETLMVSFHRGMPMAAAPFTAGTVDFAGNHSECYVASGSGTVVDFSINFAMAV